MSAATLLMSPLLFQILTTTVKWKKTHLRARRAWKTGHVSKTGTLKQEPKKKLRCET